MPRITAEDVQNGGTNNGGGGGGVQSGYYQGVLNEIVFTGNLRDSTGTEAVYLDIQVPGLERSQRLYFDSVYDANGDIHPTVLDAVERMKGEGKQGDKWLSIQQQSWNRIAQAMEPETYDLEEGESIGDYIANNGFDWDEFEGRGIGIGFLGFIGTQDSAVRTRAEKLKILFPMFPGGISTSNGRYYGNDLRQSLVAYDSVPRLQQSGKVPEDTRLESLETRTKAAATPSGSSRKAPPARGRKAPPKRKTA